MSSFPSCDAEDDDYVPLERTLVFMPSITETCFNISIVDDEVHELAENFTVHLTSPDPRIVVNVKYFTVTILDEDSELYTKPIL